MAAQSAVGVAWLVAFVAAMAMAGADASEPRRSQQYGYTRLDLRVAGAPAFIILPE